MRNNINIRVRPKGSVHYIAQTIEVPTSAKESDIDEIVLAWVNLNHPDRETHFWKVNKR